MKHPVMWLILALVVLVVPTIVYLFFLVPELSEQYNILMTSGGIVGGGGLYLGNKIPDNIKHSGLLKTATNAFTIMTVTVLVEQFIMEIIGLAFTVLVSYITYKILMEVYRSARARKQSLEAAREAARSVVEGS